MSTNYTYAPINIKENQSKTASLKSSDHYTKAPGTKASGMGAFQRVLLEANGTVTAMLEAYLSEQIEVIKLSENVVKVNLDFPNMDFKKEERVIARKVLLQGKSSRRNFIYAESIILIDNMDGRFSDKLLNTKTPIGKLWSQQKVETFKEIIASGKESADGLANYFGIDPEDNLFSRTYTVSSQGKITMIITEKFPERSLSLAPLM